MDYLSSLLVYIIVSNCSNHHNCILIILSMFLVLESDISLTPALEKDSALSKFVKTKKY